MSDQMHYGLFLRVFGRGKVPPCLQLGHFVFNPTGAPRLLSHPDYNATALGPGSVLVRSAPVAIWFRLGVANVRGARVMLPVFEANNKVGYSRWRTEGDHLKQLIGRKRNLVDQLHDARRGQPFTFLVAPRFSGWLPVPGTPRSAVPRSTVILHKA